MIFSTGAGKEQSSTSGATVFNRHALRISSVVHRSSSTDSPPDRDPVAQVRAGAARLRNLIRQVTGILSRVRPVVLFPWSCVQAAPRNTEVWVLNPTRILGYVRHERQCPSTDEVGHISAILSDIAPPAPGVIAVHATSNKCAALSDAKSRRTARNLCLARACPASPGMRHWCPTYEQLQN